jgi:hypothetical protein
LPIITTTTTTTTTYTHLILATLSFYFWQIWHLKIECQIL